MWGRRGLLHFVFWKYESGALQLVCMRKVVKLKENVCGCTQLRAINLICFHFTKNRKKY